MGLTTEYKHQPLTFSRAAAGFSALIGVVSLLVLMHAADGSGVILGHFRILRVVQMVPVLLLTLLAGLLFGLSYSPRWASKAARVSQRIRVALPARGWHSLVSLALPSLLLPVFLASPLKVNLEHTFPGIWFAGHLALLAAVWIHAAHREVPFAESLVIPVITFAVVYQLAIFLPQISDYPFSLAWSESSQHYFASTFFSRQLYSVSLPLPVINFSSGLLMSVPFLIRGLPIWFHRLWTVFLWVGLSFASAHAFSTHFREQSRLVRALFTGWGFLYLLQVPVYYDLQICVFLVLAGFASKDPKVRLGSVLLASAWAGICRVNWFPLPGFLAATIYILETRMEARSWRYLIPPVTWIGLGTSLAFGTNALYMFFSGNPLYFFSSTFTSPLLWYRLLPSPTNPTGVLLQVVFFALPLGLVLLAGLRRRMSSYHPLRLAALAVSMGVFLLGGLLVSTKIGGGNNMHNLDAFSVLLWVVAGYIYFGHFAADQTTLRQERPVLAGWAALIAVIPILTILPSKTLPLPTPRPDPLPSIAAIQSLIDQASSQKNGEVLFISERQLLAFGKIKEKQLVADYDKWFLIEMAMAGNQQYFDLFHRDLRDHRFALIVSEPLQSKLRGQASEFGEENDVWVKWVSGPLLQEYKTLILLKPVNVEILVPKSH